MTTRRICVVTGNRAEYGQLYWVLKALRSDKRFDLKLLVTGTHLSREHGYTVQWIRKDGFAVARRIKLSLDDDTPLGVTTALAGATRGFGEALRDLKPDWLLLLGDRYESLAAAQAALIARVPIAHLCGGDVTEGVIDEACRHAITKMAHVHLVTHAASARRVRQLGEDPRHVHVVGNPALDSVRRMERLDRNELSRRLGYAWRERNLLVTYHPVTLGRRSPAEEFRQLLTALRSLPEDTGFILTRPNPDTGSRAIDREIDRFVRAEPRAKAYAALGSLLYLNAMRQVDAVVGNSSSGISEAPSLGVPTVDIGDRQKGRLAARSVIRCAAAAPSIRRAILQALKRGRIKTVNPYGDGRTSGRVVSILGRIADPSALIVKRFHDKGPGR